MYLLFYIIGSLIDFNILQNLDLAKVCFLQRITPLVSCVLQGRKTDPTSITSYCLYHDFRITECVHTNMTEKKVLINASSVFETMDIQMHFTKETIVSTNVCRDGEIKYKPLVNFVSCQTEKQIHLSTRDLVFECTETSKFAEDTEQRNVKFKSSPINSTLPDCLLGFKRALFFHLYRRGIMKYQLMRLRTFQTAIPYSAIRLAEKGFFSLGGKIQCFSCSKIHDDYNRINGVETAHQLNCR